MKTLRTLWPYLRPYRRPLRAGLGWLALTNLLALLIPWMLKGGIDAIGHHAYRRVALLAALLTLAALLRAGTRILSRQRFLHTARFLEVDMRQDLLSGLLGKPTPFFDRHRTGDLLSRFTNDLANVRMFAGFGLLTLVNTALVYLSTLTVLLALSPALTAVALLPYPFMLLLIRRLSRDLLHYSSLVQEGLGTVSEAVEEAVSGQEVIRAFDLAACRQRHFDARNEAYLQRSLSLVRLRALIQPVMVVVGPLGTLLVLWLGGRRVMAGTMTLGELVAFNAYLVQLAWPTVVLGWVLTLLQRAAASLERLTPLLGPPAALAAPLPHPPPAESPPPVKAAGLSFAYGESPVLREISFDLPGGSVVGVAGPTGSGKSTLLRLLAGLYPLPDQCLFVAGADVARTDGERHRRRLAMVPQEGRLFSGTIGENLLYAVPGGGDALLRRVADDVCLAGEIAAFGQGYATRVGEGGLALSGGQRQRVALGRALARGGDLWLLDDPFSHLDAATARSVWSRLRPQLAGCTVILAAGRVSLLEQADHVLILEHGRLVEQGLPERLRESGGLFSRLWQCERLNDELEALS